MKAYRGPDAEAARVGAAAAPIKKPVVKSAVPGAAATSSAADGDDAAGGPPILLAHRWENDIAQLDRVCRPANLPSACPGWDHVLVSSRGFKVAVFTVLGRQFMNMKAEDPFACADRMIERLRGQADAIIVEIHADKSCLTDGKPDIAKIHPIIYAQATYWECGKQVDKAFSAGKKFAKK